MQKFIPSLWFDKNAEEAINFYLSAFSILSSDTAPSQIISIKRYPDVVPEEFMKGMEGKVWNAIFDLAGHCFMALDGGPLFQFTPAISFWVRCPSAEIVETVWAALSEAGKILMPLDSYPFSPKYGWIQDQYGVSWQVVLQEGNTAQTIVPCLLFSLQQTGKAEEAINFYRHVFGTTEPSNIVRYDASQAPAKEGTVAYAEFILDGQPFTAMDSAIGHDFTFNEAVSFYVECETQADIDKLWEALSAAPESEQCGWLKDRYGVSWQIIPKRLGELLSEPNSEKSGRVLDAMLKMKKIEVAELEAAYHQPS